METPNLDRQVAAFRHAFICPKSSPRQDGECVCDAGKVQAELAALKSEREDLEAMLRVELSDLYGHREFLGWQRVDSGWLLERCDTKTGVRSGVLTVPDNDHGIPALTPEARAALSGTRTQE